MSTLLLEISFNDNGVTHLSTEVANAGFLSLANAATFKFADCAPCVSSACPPRAFGSASRLFNELYAFRGLASDRESPKKTTLDRSLRAEAAV